VNGETAIRFGPFLFDPLKQLLLHGNEPLRFATKAMRAVECILQNRERLITYEDLVKAIWEDWSHGKSDNDVQKVVRPICKALVFEGHAFIENVPSHGYRFMPLQGETAPQASVINGLPDNQEDLVFTPVGHLERRLLFSYPSGNANAICLWGTGAAYVSPDRDHFRVEYKHEPYVIPQKLRKQSNERVVFLEAQARRWNKIFFNGPCVRLMHWLHNQAGADEQHVMKLVLGPVGWYDFEGTNGLIREEGRQPEAYQQYVDLQTIQSGNIEEASRLSNITGNAVTIFSCDGKVGFQIRGKRVSSVERKITSTVDENTNRYKDDVDEADWNRRLSTGADSLLGQGNSYRPSGVPHPLAAVRRGMANEVSPRLLEHIGPFGIKLTGLAFGLDSLHPDVQWIVLANVPAEKIIKMRCEHKGEEADEGRIKFVPASFGARSTQELLARKDWLAANKGSLIRAIELIDNYKPNARPADVFDILAEAR